jgi:putative endonuclease
VYVIQNPRGRFYVGQMEDLAARIEQHNSGCDSTKYAPKNGPWSLVWSEEHATRSAAMARERQIKAMKSPRWIREHLLKGRASPGTPGLTARF